LVDAGEALLEMAFLRPESLLEHLDLRAAVGNRSFETKRDAHRRELETSVMMALKTNLG